jgi:hypothetical protein
VKDDDHTGLLRSNRDDVMAENTRDRSQNLALPKLLAQRDSRFEEPLRQSRVLDLQEPGVRPVILFDCPMTLCKGNSLASLLG